MDNKYQAEINAFKQNFCEFKDLRMAMYGIGRYTGTIISGLGEEFQFVALMDKDPENIGKEVFGVPIMSKEEVEKAADVIIINTSETYWELIYKRIEDIKIPVYFRNGKKATLRDKVYYHNPYVTLSRERLEEKVEKAQVVSFDFFDTLFMRTLCNPRDVFSLLEDELKEIWSGSKSLTEIRNRTIEKLSVYYMIDELYEAMAKEADVSLEIVEIIKKKEWELEKRVLVPRTNILDLLKRCVQEGKEVYIISDMYLPIAFYQEVFKGYEIDFPAEHILISSEVKKSKEDGSLWAYYRDNILKGRAALHIGDNEKSDIQMAKENGIDAYLTPNPWNMLQGSSLGDITSDMCTEYASIVLGLVQKRLFEDPYALHDIREKFTLFTLKDMGYTVFGPLILTYLLWVINEAKKDNVEQFVFFARDGYFLLDDYKYLCSLTDMEANGIYLGISRQLAMSVRIRNKQDLLEYLRLPYSGTVDRLFWNRLGIKIEADETKTIEDYVEIYYEQIITNLKRSRQNYEAYLKHMNISKRAAIVDLCYYGNCQRYLNELLTEINEIDKPLDGYYFVAALSEENPNMKYQKMKACFQDTGDRFAKKSFIMNHIFYLESFLTAPYGMIKEVDENFQFLCAEDGQNQVCFSAKEELNEGVKAFINDYVALIGDSEIEVDAVFVDKYYGNCMLKGFDFSKDIKKTFFMENAMISENDMNLFE